MGDAASPTPAVSLLPCETFVFPNKVDSPPQDTLKILQWNVLADQFSGGPDNFIAVQEEVLQYAYREPLIVQHVLNQKADIVCLEEVDRFESLNEHMSKAGYTGFFSRKYDPEKLTTRDGIAFFYKSDAYTHTQFSDGAYVDQRGGKSSQGYVCVQMERKTDKKRFVVFATHLKAKHSPANEKTRLGQLKQLSELIVPLRHLPTFVVGDFNTEPNHEAPLWFASQHHLGLSSVYQHPHLVKNNVLPYSTWKIRPGSEQKRIIDFVWHSPYHTTIVSALCAPKESLVPKERFPNARYPSDHLALCVEFAFIK